MFIKKVEDQNHFPYSVPLKLVSDLHGFLKVKFSGTQYKCHGENKPGWLVYLQQKMHISITLFYVHHNSSASFSP